MAQRDRRHALRHPLPACHGVTWGIDPRRFEALGDSAGGQLVSVDALAVGQDPQWNSAQFGSESSALDAVVDCWGLVDLTAPGWGRVARGMGRYEFGVPFGSASAVLRAASPVTYVHPGAPPFLVVQGLSDTLVPPRQSTELVARLRAAGDTAALLDVANAGHGLGPTGAAAMTPPLSSVAQRVVSFLVTATA